MLHIFASVYTVLAKNFSSVKVHVLNSGFHSLNDNYLLEWTQNLTNRNGITSALTIFLHVDIILKLLLANEILQSTDQRFAQDLDNHCL